MMPQVHVSQMRPLDLSRSYVHRFAKRIGKRRRGVSTDNCGHPRQDAFSGGSFRAFLGAETTSRWPLDLFGLYKGFQKVQADPQTPAVSHGLILSIDPCNWPLLARVRQDGRQGAGADAGTPASSSTLRDACGSGGVGFLGSSWGPWYLMREPSSRSLQHPPATQARVVCLS